MTFEKVESTEKMVNAFALTAKEDVEAGAALFQNYVGLLGKNFDLAVSNVGEVLFRRVIGCEQGITKEEAKRYPNVRESITEARRRVGCLQVRSL